MNPPKEINNSANEENNSAKRGKLIGFSNWPRWSALTKAMLIEKDVWDLVSVGQRAVRASNPLWDTQVKEDRMAIGTAMRIIQGGVSDDLFNSIIDLDDSQLMWEKLRSVCSQTGPGVVYSILQELLTYPKINKPKGFEKSVTSFFSEVRFLCNCLRAAITPNKDI